LQQAAGSGEPVEPRRGVFLVIAQAATGAGRQKEDGIMAAGTLRCGGTGALEARRATPMPIAACQESARAAPSGGGELIKLNQAAPGRTVQSARLGR
jgi:hypothetical protein